jgi:hypothetical protein
MAEFIADFAKAGVPKEPDGRLHGPAFARNHAAIWSAMDDFLHDADGDALELASGTGEHIADFARRTPRLTWWPSDIVPAHLASIEAWRRDAKLPNLHAPQRIDLDDPDWRCDGADKLTAMLCINVLHITPWRVAQNLFAGAGRRLREDGRLFVYGPFKRGGAHTAPSNEAFDRSLRAENPSWGVRDVAELDTLALTASLSPAEIVAMPANNLVLVFKRALRQNRPNEKAG